MQPLMFKTHLMCVINFVFSVGGGGGIPIASGRAIGGSTIIDSNIYSLIYSSL